MYAINFPICTVGLYVSLWLMIFLCPFLHCKALRTAMYKCYINSIIIIIIIIYSVKKGGSVGNALPLPHAKMLLLPMNCFLWLVDNALDENVLTEQMWIFAAYFILRDHDTHIDFLPLLKCKALHFAVDFFKVLFFSLWKHPFLLHLRRWGRFARRNVYDSAAEIPYW